MIVQRTRHDCAICTIAMALSLDYGVVMSTALGKDAHGSSPFDPDVGCSGEYIILERLGLEQMKTFRVMNKPFSISPEYFLHFSWRRRAIMAVPSLNNLGGWHSIYYDGNEVLDPCQPTEAFPDLHSYARDGWSTLRPNEIILFA